MNIKNVLPFVAVLATVLIFGGGTAWLKSAISDSWTHIGLPSIVIPAPTDVSPSPITKPSPSPKPTPKVTRTFVQFFSAKTKDEAFAFVKDATAKYGSLLNGRTLQVYKANLKNGVWYRVVLELPPADAKKVCEVAKSHGVDCLVLTF